MKGEILPGRQPLCNLYIEREKSSGTSPDTLHRIYISSTYTRARVSLHVSHTCVFGYPCAYASDVGFRDAHNNREYLETVEPMIAVEERYIR